MAVTKDLTRNIPFSKANKVQQWELDYTYENDSEGDATYYKTVFNIIVLATDPDGTVNFTPKAKGSWTKAQIVALCPVSHWDTIFASQVESVITNPVVPPTPDDNFELLE